MIVLKVRQVLHVHPESAHPAVHQAVCGQWVKLPQAACGRSDKLLPAALPQVLDQHLVLLQVFNINDSNVFLIYWM